MITTRSRWTLESNRIGVIIGGHPKDAYVVAWVNEDSTVSFEKAAHDSVMMISEQNVLTIKGRMQLKL